MGLRTGHGDILTGRVQVADTSHTDWHWHGVGAPGKDPIGKAQVGATGTVLSGHLMHRTWLAFQ